MEIEAFCRLTHAEIEPHELDLIKEIDAYVLSMLNNKGKPPPDGTKQIATPSDVAEMKARIRGTARKKGNDDG